MKSVFRFSVIGVLTLAFAGASFAQDPCADIEAKQALYGVFTTKYPLKPLADQKEALKAAKSYVEKYGKCEDDKAQIDYFNDYIPKQEKIVKDREEQEALDALYARFNDSLKNANWDGVYASGKEILAHPKPDSKLKVDITILLGSIGFDEAINNNDKYNAETVKYAQDAIRQLEGGAVGDKYGVGNAGKGVIYKTKDNALGWLNMTVGYIKYYRDKNQKDAIPFLYKATQQANSGTKTNALGYVAIGNWYTKEVEEREKERTQLLADAKAAEDQANKAGISEEEKKAAIDKIKESTDKAKAVYALQKGYADRAIDSFSRAYNAYTDARDKGLKDDVYNTMKELYKFRNNGKEAGLDVLISSTKTKPMPNPSSEVMPVVEATPAEGTTTGTAPKASTTTPDATTNKPGTTAKPAAGAKPAATTTTAKPAAANATVKPASTATTTTPAKKPAPKKKGTR
ncbi:MAG: hypothetical protein LUM44_21500 [Pyrinomonadaceae bacterium]|nr:hypothetical protein [Pyrinomonadaceae bacterium]